MNAQRQLDFRWLTIYLLVKQILNFGSALPQYTGGVQNTFNVFKNFTINVNIDYSYGGKFFSLSDFWGTFSGLTGTYCWLKRQRQSFT